MRNFVPALIGSLSLIACGLNESPVEGFGIFSRDGTVRFISNTNNMRAARLDYRPEFAPLNVKREFRLRQECAVIAYRVRVEEPGARLDGKSPRAISVFPLTSQEFSSLRTKGPEALSDKAFCRGR